MDIDAYIPLHGTYETHRNNFKYDGRRDAFICTQGQILKPKQTKFSHGRKQLAYVSSKKICDQCPMREGCVNNRGIKQITSTMYKRQYERMQKKLKSKKGQLLYSFRMHTVEPVFGSLQQHYGLRWMNVRGRSSASKVMLMSAAAFNLKKWLKNTLLNPDITAIKPILVLSDIYTALRTSFANYPFFHSLSLHLDCQYVRWV